MEKTEAELQKRLERILNEKDKSIALSYARVLNELRAELAKLYEKYEKEGKLSYVEMARHNQLKQLFLHIGEILSDCTDNTRDVLEELFGETYLEGFYRTAWAIETEALCALGYPAVTSNVIKKMLNNKIQGLTLNERLERNRKKIIHTIQTEITQGLVKNETYGMMAKRLKKTLEGDAVKAMRIVRTEAHRVNEQARHDAAEHAHKHGIVMVKVWNSAKDARSRKRHEKLDGQTVPLDEDFKMDGVSGPQPGSLSGGAKENVNCRCFLSYEISEVQSPTDKRLADVTYEDWKKRFDAGESEQSTKGKSSKFMMNRSAVESAEYVRKIDKLPEGKGVKRLIRTEMIQAIKHRNGTEFEDLIFIDSVNNTMRKSIDYEVPRTAKPTKKMMQMLSETDDYTIIAIHNHPSSSVPSFDDIAVAAIRKYKYGLIACHDGEIFKYQITGEINEPMYAYAVAKLDKSGYTENSLKEFCKNIIEAGIEMEVL